jgi:hypothetical protein
MQAKNPKVSQSESDPLLCNQEAGALRAHSAKASMRSQTDRVGDDVCDKTTLWES